MQQWWSAAREHFDELQGAFEASRAALERRDQPALEKSCQQMHDAGVVKLRAHLPAPDPDLTAELDAAINDAHDAAHMCLAAISGSLNNYVGEFVANLDQAEMHLKAALASSTRAYSRPNALQARNGTTGEPRGPRIRRADKRDAHAAQLSLLNLSATRSSVSVSQVEFARYFCSKVAQYVSPIRGALVHGLRHPTQQNSLTPKSANTH